MARVRYQEEYNGLGLVSRLVGEGEELASAIELVEQVGAHSPLPLSRLRRCVDAADLEVTEQGLAVEAEAFRDLIDSEDAAEGLSAFLDKRPPQYRGR